MATIEGAPAVGLGDEMRSLKPGKQAGEIAWRVAANPVHKGMALLEAMARGLL